MDRNAQEPAKVADFGEIFWCESGSAYFSLGEKSVLLQPNQVWYYPPGQVHQFKAGRKGFNYRWLAIEGTGTAPLFQGLGIEPGCQEVEKCPVDLFGNIENNITDPVFSKRLEILSDAFKILTLIAAGVEKTVRQGLVEDMKRFVDSNFHSNDLNVCRMAEIYHIHRVVLNRKFKAAFDISLSDYIISRRLQEALKLLKNSALSLTEIARRCGFSSAVYFNKAIRKATGYPPGRLRA